MVMYTNMHAELIASAVALEHAKLRRDELLDAYEQAKQDVRDAYAFAPTMRAMREAQLQRARAQYRDAVGVVQAFADEYDRYFAHVEQACQPPSVSLWMRVKGVMSKA
jgi:hypothetical protein